MSLSFRHVGLAVCGALALGAAGALGAGCGPSSGTPTPVVPFGVDLGRPGADPDGDSDHDGYSPRDGDCNDLDPRTFPGAPEICGDHQDQDCNTVADESCDDDGDGYNVWADQVRPGGDCDDLEPLINPGAAEVPGNQRDDNCDKLVDESPPACDSKLFPVDAASFAASLGLCKPWVEAAGFNRIAPAASRTVASHFGSRIKPRAGESMVLLSTGMAYLDRSDRNFVSPRPGTIFQGQEPNPLPVSSTNICTSGAQAPVAIANDLTSLTLTLKAPTNARAFRFQFNFFSAEYSDFVGAQYNDMFVVKMTSKKIDGRNIVFDANGQPLTVNTAFFQVCLPQPICSMCNACGGNQNCKTTTCGVRCSRKNTDLEQTGYDEMIVGRDNQQVGGATGWLTTSAPVEPGETFTLELFLFDAADHEYDSAVLLDGFEWIFDDSVSVPVTG